MSIIKKGKNIIGVYKGSTPISKISKGDLSVFELNVVYNVTATFNVTSTSEPTKIANGNAYAISGFTRMCVDGVKVPVTSGYTFSTTGEHTVQYKLTDETTFANAAFSDCTSLTSVIIGEGVKSTGYLTFDGCTNLRSATLPNTVTKIGNSTFSGCRSLSSITIPNSVTSIINSAFYGCTSLTSVTIPSSVKELDAFIFENCTNLRTVTIENGLERIGGKCFRKCTNLTSFVIPSSVTEIGGGAFEYCTSLTEFTIPNTVTSMGDYVFNYCSGLTEFVFPDSITTIGNSFFQACTSLTSVTIPESVTSIGRAVFMNCTSLQEINCYGTVAPTLDVSVFDNMPSTGTLIYPCDSDYSTWLEQLGWEDTCAIAYDITAVFNVTNTTSPTKLCHSTMTSAFTEMAIDGEKVDITSGYTFNTLGEHTVQYMLADKTTIGDLAFYYCRSLTSVDIGNSVTTIGHNAFGGCTSLTSIEIPDSVTSIGNNTFFDCRSLSSVTIPSSVTSIGGNAFYECYIHINNFINNSSATGYPWSATIYDKIQDDGLYIYGTTAVGCKPNATNVTIPNSVTSIGSEAFSNCTSLEEIVITDSVTSIGDNAFIYCSGLSSITCLATTAPTLGTDVFNGLPTSGTLIYPCDSDYSTWLEQLGWEDTCNSAKYDVTAVFDVKVYDANTPTVLCGSGQTSAFTEMYVDGEQIDVTSAYTFNTTGEHTVNYMMLDNTNIVGSTFNGCTRMTSIELPSSITKIYAYAFKNCYSLTSIEIPDSVTSIEGYVFSGCTSLSSVTIPNSVTSIAGGAFYDCIGLKEVVIPSGVTKINSHTFNRCANLRKVTIGSGVQEIGVSTIAFLEQPVFSGCTSLTEIVSLAPTAPKLGSKAFNGIENNNGVLFVPQGADYGTWTAVLTSWTIQYI